jgi:hypothetical protein
MSGELQPSMGDIRPHGHLKIGRFTQHFVDVLNLEQTPLEFFDTMYPGTPREEQRKYLGRFVSTWTSLVMNIVVVQILQLIHLSYFISGSVGIYASPKDG